MKRKRNLDKTSKLQLGLCFSVFILMLVILVILANKANQSIVSVISIPLVCLAFAFLMKEPVSAGWLKTFEVSLRGFRFKLERTEKHPYEMAVYVKPRGERPPTTEEATSLHDQGNEEREKKNYLEAARLYKKAFQTDPTYWPARVNQAVALKEAGKYDAALSILRSVKETCGEPTYVIQAYINTGDCLVDKSENCSDLHTAIRWRRAAYENYRVAYVKDKGSIVSAYHLWFGALIAEKRTEALKLSRIIKKDERYDELTSEARHYFQKYHKEASNLNMEELIMNWRKLVVAVMVAFVALNVSFLLLVGNYSDSLFKAILAVGGVVNGQA